MTKESKDINYPSWESGIPLLLPEKNPYWSSTWVRTDYGMYVVPYSPLSKEAGCHKIDDKYTQTFEYERDAWSYMEILHWLREKGVEFLIMYENHHLFTKIEYYKNGDFEVESNQIFKTYYEALDRAIFYCLKFLINERK